MTDAETYAAICADFPFTTEVLRGLRVRLSDLRGRVKPDGTIGPTDRERMRILTMAVRELEDAMKMVETDGDPEDFIPF